MIISSKVESFYIETMKAYYNQDRDLAFSLSSNKKLISGQCNILSEEHWRVKGIVEILENFKDIIASIHNISRRVYNWK